MTPPSPRRQTAILIALWALFYFSFPLFTPPLLDDADSVHAEVAREMVASGNWTTLYANGIRYLEKAPILYWSMATSFKLFGVHTFTARIPLAFMVLALILITQAFATRAFSQRTGFYASLILLSSFGIFIFSRILLPDIGVCLWLTLSIYAFWRTEAEPQPNRLWSYLFAASCALNILTKGLIGLVFPIGIVLIYLLTTRGLKGTLRRISQLHPIAGLAVFFLIGAPWHILIALQNPSEGTPPQLHRVNGHWFLADPTLGNVHGWTWFYFMNEHVLRYLNLRVPRDYDTVPLFLFWGLLLVWLMPWSAFAFKALARVPWRNAFKASTLAHTEKTRLLLGIWALLPLLFFSFSTRQEYYVLPSIPALALLIASWLEEETLESENYAATSPLSRSARRITTVLFVIGSLVAIACIWLIFHSAPPRPGQDLSALLQQNPGDYALSFGHFLDLNATAMGAFRGPLFLTAIAFLVGTAGAWWFRRNSKPYLSNLFLFVLAFTFLAAAFLGLRTFSPVLTSKQLADAIKPILQPSDLIVIHGEYESGSTLGFYLQHQVHIFEGHSANLWYGSFFTDAPHIFEDQASLEALWLSPRRVFLWTDPAAIPHLPSPSYLIIKNGGKEILSNQP